MSPPAPMPAVQAKTAGEEPADGQRPDLLAGLLSYLVPGLGQILQGRVAKGVLFLVSLYALFFYGMALGEGKNVFLPWSTDRGGVVERHPAADLYARPHFAGQFFIGIAAWPAVYQYSVYNPRDPNPPLGGFERAPSNEEINRLQRDDSKAWDLGWVYTVIAGVLNLLVIYDAIAGPAFREVPGDAKKPGGDKPGKESAPA